MAKFFQGNRNYLESNGESIDSIDELNPDYIVIAKDTSQHLDFINAIEGRLKDKIVLVEKPLFAKMERLEGVQNKYFVYHIKFYFYKFSGNPMSGQSSRPDGTIDSPPPFQPHYWKLPAIHLNW